MKKKIVDIVAFVGSGLCAVIWAIRIILDVSKKVYIYSGFMFFLDILCTVLWIIVFVVQLKNFLRTKDA